MSIATMTASQAAAATHGSFTIERHFKAAPERVFAALSDKDAKARWFRGPAGWAETERSLDFRVDGIEITAGIFPDGKKTHFRARFEEIVPNRRLVYSYRMQIGDGWLISVSLATIELSPQEGGTRMIFTEHATFINGFDDPGAEGRKTGSIALLEQMAASLEQE